MSVKSKARSYYKRDHDGKFAKVNSLTAKIHLAKAQGVKHAEPGEAKGYKPKGHASDGAKLAGKLLYDEKKKGLYKDDHAIFLAAGKKATAYNKAHPNNKISANAVVNSYKQHEFDETGKVVLLGEVLGKVDYKGKGSGSLTSTTDGSAPSGAKPTVDTSKTGISLTSSDKFPKPTALVSTGKTLGGVTGAKVYKDGNGQEWVVKSPKGGSNAYSNSNFLVDIEIAASRIQNKGGLTVPAMHSEVVDGKVSAVSKMYPNAKEAIGPNGVISDVSIKSLSKPHLLQIQQQQVLDWMISNHDAHSGNFLATSDGIVGIDKGQSFKYFGKDKLDWNYVGTTPLSPNVPVYSTLWKQMTKGQGDMLDPSEGELHGTIQRLQNIPDGEYRKLLTPYAEKAFKSGQLANGYNVSQFLDAAVKRKNNLQKDFDALYAKALAEQSVNKPKPLNVPPAPAANAVRNKSWHKLEIGDEINYGGKKHKVTYVGATAILAEPQPFTQLDDEQKIKKTEYEADPASKGEKTSAAPSKPNVNKKPGSQVQLLSDLSVGDWVDTGESELVQITDVTSGEQYSKVQGELVVNGEVTPYNVFASDIEDGDVKWAADPTGNNQKSKAFDLTTAIVESMDKNTPQNEIDQVGKIIDESKTLYPGEKLQLQALFESKVKSFNNSGTVTNQDLAGQPADFYDIIPGDKLIHPTTGHDLIVTKISPSSITYKKEATGGVGTILKSVFDQKKVSYSYDQKHAAPKPSGDFKQFESQYPSGMALNNEVSASSGDGTITEGTVVGKSGSQVYVQFHGDQDWTEFNWDGNLWVMDPQDPDALVLGQGGNTTGAKPVSAPLPPAATVPPPPTNIGPGAAPVIPQQFSPGGLKLSLPPTKMNQPSGNATPDKATWEQLAVGDYYYTPGGNVGGGKQQQVVGKTATTVTVKSVGSGNEYTHDKAKFEKFLDDKGALMGMKPVTIGSSSNPVFADQIEPGDKFKSGYANYMTIVSVDPNGDVVWKSAYGDLKNVPYEQFSAFSGGWEFVPPPSPWEQYALGDISWEQYTKVAGIEVTDKRQKLHAVEGPAPIPAAIATKETKVPPPWSKIPHPQAKTIGQAIYDRKRANEFANDHEMWLAIGKELSKYKKSNPTEAQGLSQNMIRNAARRLEFDDKGFVSWTSAEQKTAQVVEANVVSKDLKQHKPVIIRKNAEGVKVPLTAYGDASSAAGSYLQPHAFKADSTSSDTFKLFGILMTNQDESLWPSGQLSAMQKFTGGGYSSMNDYLRSGNAQYSGVAESTLKSRINNLRAAFKNRKVVTPLKDWLIVTRGSGAWDVGISKSHVGSLAELQQQVGKTVNNKAFMSSSITDKPAFGGQIRTIFRLPPGFPGMYVDGNPSSKSGGYGGLSSHVGEREVILPDGLEYKVVSAEKSSMGGYEYDVVVEVTGGYEKHL